MCIQKHFAAGNAAVKLLAHKIRLYPNNKQKTLLAKSCGTSRFAYNWALTEWKKQYESGGKPNEAALRKELIEYKSLLYGRKVVIAPRFYPSSKLCNGCGTKTKSMPLSVREWTCEKCGMQHHRDTNAAINLKEYAARSAVSACGEFSAAVCVTSCNRDEQPQ